MMRPGLRRDLRSARPQPTLGGRADGRVIRCGARPIERDVFGRVGFVFEFEAIRVDRQDRRLPPGDELRAWPGFAARRIDQPRVLARHAGRPEQRLRPSLDLAGDLDAPMRLIGRYLEADLRALDPEALPPAGEAFIDPARETAGAAADDRRQGRHLPVVGVLVDVEAGNATHLARPQIALPAADPYKAQIVEFDVAVMPLADMPEQHRLAEAVIRRLPEGAGTGDRAAAIVEPIADDVPIRDVAHRGLRSRSGY